MMLAGVLAFLRWIYPFLAITEPSRSNVLVMEGWLYPAGVRDAVRYFKAGNYNYILTTGGPLPSDRGLEGISQSNTWAASGAYWLRRSGVSADLIHAVPSFHVGKDRTYASAVALKTWLAENAPEVKSITIVTGDVHARRTRLLFQKALGPDMSVGIIATRNPEYDPSHWWESSEGVRDVISESVAYLYARVLFLRPN
jgi:uncharacterized SAM-binding protein YcdF (DUF218 family)